jgi:hypothetical protein
VWSGVDSQIAAIQYKEVVYINKVVADRLGQNNTDGREGMR